MGEQSQIELARFAGIYWPSTGVLHVPGSRCDAASLITKSDDQVQGVVADPPVTWNFQTPDVLDIPRHGEDASAMHYQFFVSSIPCPNARLSHSLRILSFAMLLSLT